MLLSSLTSTFVGCAAAIALFAAPPRSATHQTTELHRGTLMTPGGELVFGLRTVLAQPLVLDNGEESSAIRATREGERWTIEMPPYASKMVLDVVGRKGDSISAEGTWTKPTSNGEQTLAVRIEPWPHTIVDHRGVYGPAYPIAGEPLDVAGRWRVEFDGEQYPAVGIFGPVEGRPGEVAGTFLTTMGDYRFLAGTARGDELALSCFDGAHAFLFRAKLGADGRLTGDFWSGATWHQRWTAVRDEEASLPDPFTLSRVNPDVQLAELALLGLDGERRTLRESLGRVTLVQLFGTWCPNCGDAAKLLGELRNEYGQRGLAVVGLAFEAGDDLEAKRARVAAYTKTRGADWPIFLAGPPDKSAARAAFPVLDRIHAYPTTLFVDASGAVRAVYTGFSGPATCEAHVALVSSFRAHVERLLAE